MPRYLPEGQLLNTPENIEYTRSVKDLERAIVERRIIEAVAEYCDNHGNLHTKIAGIHALIPRRDAAIGMDAEDAKNIAVISRVGKPVCFRVTGLNDSATLVYLNRRQVQEEALETLLNTLVPGDVIPARATHLENFGCFVDIGCGIISLINIENISVSRISHPSDRFLSGDDLFAVVKAVDKDAKRIYLSHKELLGTWNENAAFIKRGETVVGIVRNIERYGVFVELAPNLSGLAEYKEGLRVGDNVSVYIKSIIPEKMKIKLVIIDTLYEKQKRPPIKYFIKEGRLGVWRFSPPCSERTVETDFTAAAGDGFPAEGT